MAKPRVLEDETKNILKADYFSGFDWTRVIGNIDLAVSSNPQLGALPTNYLWAETKQGKKKDIYESFIQLILTIGKGRIYEQEMPPYYLGAADAEKIAFIEYDKVMHVFSKTDFNWNVTPSDHSTKEFRELYKLLQDNLTSDVLIFKFAYDDKLLRTFIRRNFKEGRAGVKKQSVGKNNFTFVYYDWVKTVKQTIAVDWLAMQKAGILDSDFFLADLMSKDGMSIKDKLKVVLEKTKYKVLVKVEFGGIFDETYKDFGFKDGQKAYNQFWNRYERPPKPVYQHHILDRKDLLVPQSIRELKGSYYTPERWVRLSQDYLAKALGEDWQDEYYVWDCAAGSGNLLKGLTNKYNLFASTLDDSDVKVMHDAIDSGHLNLVKNNVFQFDFLNDGYIIKDGNLVSDLAGCPKVPKGLRDILSDPIKRKRLIIYINPPYAEVSTKDMTTEGRKLKTGVNNTNVRTLYGKELGVAGREIYVQFLMRIYQEIQSCMLAEFSKLKVLQGSAFSGFMNFFKASLRKLFVVPADTFDNVRGQFPIGFFIWNTGLEDPFESITADVYDSDGNVLGEKIVSRPDPDRYINKWISIYRRPESAESIGFLDGINGNDFQHNNIVYITLSKHDLPNPRGIWIDKTNLIPVCVYFAIRKCVTADWLNDRDQYFIPNDNWGTNPQFLFDCLIYTLFHPSLKIQAAKGTNHWIPFYEDEVLSPETMSSRFMADFLHGKVHRELIVPERVGLFDEIEAKDIADCVPIDNFSREALSVYNAGKELWMYYMSMPDANSNASLYDIKGYFQGFKTTDKGKKVMNPDSTDDRYTLLNNNLKEALRILESHIEPKVYDYGFLL